MGLSASQARLISLTARMSDIEYQERLYDFIVSIINNEDLDYISKLDKLKCFIDTNKSLELYSRERWKF